MHPIQQFEDTDIYCRRPTLVVSLTTHRRTSLHQNTTALNIIRHYRITRKNFIFVLW